MSNRNFRKPLAITAALLTASLLGTAAVQHNTDRPDLHVTLESAIQDGRMVFIGKGGTIDGKVNPTLHADPGDTIKITYINGDGALHDVALPDLNAATKQISGKGSTTTLVFKATQDGTFEYICSVPGHQAAGMEGQLVVGQPQQAAAPALKTVAADPSQVPPPITRREPAHLKYTFETTEEEATLADGTTYRFWTFNGQVPGPMIRVRVGDTVDVTLRNREDSLAPHSIDFHAVTGPGGGAVATQTQPGGETGFTFKALNPGLYVYHCATPMVAHHITNGMYGLILVEPEEGLPEVDREFYVMQGELYTAQKHGEKGSVDFSQEKLLNERPEYFFFNGSVDALKTEYPMKANVGETVRLYFGVGGPNYISNFHVIGEIFDRVYDEGSISSPPLKDVQTTLVPAGGAVITDFKLDVPGRYILVDHALSRMERGLAGFLEVEGEENHAVYHGEVTEGSGH